MKQLSKILERLKPTSFLWEVRDGVRATEQQWEKSVWQFCVFGLYLCELFSPRRQTHSATPTSVERNLFHFKCDVCYWYRAWTHRHLPSMSLGTWPIVFIQTFYLIMTASFCFYPDQCVELLWLCFFHEFFLTYCGCLCSAGWGYRGFWTIVHLRWW